VHKHFIVAALNSVMTKNFVNCHVIRPTPNSQVHFHNFKLIEKACVLLMIRKKTNGMKTSILGLKTKIKKCRKMAGNQTANVPETAVSPCVFVVPGAVLHGPGAWVYVIKLTLDLLLNYMLCILE
jgi:hypothetical protein